MQVFSLCCQDMLTITDSEGMDILGSYCFLYMYCLTMFMKIVGFYQDMKRMFEL